MKSVFISHNIEYILVDVKNGSVFDYIEKIKAEDGKVLGYKLLENIAYYSRRYRKHITCEKGDRSDGATSAPDIDSFCWIFHDELCVEGAFDDGSVCNNWQASSVLSDILKDEGRWFRARTWHYATWLFGGGEARENGLI